MKSAINTMSEYFDVPVEDLEVNEDAVSLKQSIKGAYAIYEYCAFIIPKDALFRFVVYCPLTIPEDRRLAMAEFITRSNEYFMVGNFNLNMEQGILRFAASIPFNGDELSLTLVDNVVKACLWSMDGHFPGIMGVVEGVSPQLALMKGVHQAVQRK